VSAALLLRLRAEAPALNLAAVDEEYKDPFWWDRYGERGRRFMIEDGQHHYSYVAEAVAAGSTGLMVRYARWLRGVLTSRGMCSEHLADGFRIRARVLAARGWDDVAPALAAFAAGEAALRHDEGPAAGVVPEYGQRVELPATLAGSDAELQHEARTLLSYLADALADERPQRLREHLAWRRGFDARRGRGEDHSPALLRALAPTLPPNAPATRLLAQILEP